MDPRRISISDFDYKLPDDKIALFPLEKRDASKVLIYKNGELSETFFSNIHEYIPENSTLVFNNTKVINARLRFNKTTGSIVEIFCLEPHGEINEYSTAMNREGEAEWKCFIGGAAKWKEAYLEKTFMLNHKSIVLRARIINKLPDAYLVGFSWNPSDISFAEILETAGDVPLPPYIKRDAEEEDNDRYQTIYAKEEGSVAAPTAGLHFTEEVFERMTARNINKEYITLHVGAGTFKPVKAELMQDHEMHTEWIDVSIESIQNIVSSLSMIIAVGTTSLRTIETLYWLGVKAYLQPELQKLELAQWDVYDEAMRLSQISPSDSLHTLAEWLKKNDKRRLFTQTQLLISPGYSFKIAKGLITNFHQPKSTLLLLIAAAMGDKWKVAYDYALRNDFRFLSYGDANLIYFDEN
jgi:S-adenosylmethionine:tRNA ribosyltransferase-isomerase